MKIKLDVGYRGLLNDLKRILDYETVKSVYTGGIKNIIAGGRGQYVNSLNDLEKQASYAHSKNVRVNLALNAPCNVPCKSDGNWWTTVRTYFKDIESVGVDGVIISHPFLMELVKDHTDMQLIVSTICDVRNGRVALYYENIGADVLVPSMNVNWDFNALGSIKESCKKMKLRIMVNEPCLPDCPWRSFHYSHMSHGISNGGFSNRDYLSKCFRAYFDRPELFLMNSVIRPEDIYLFNDFTFEFKIVSRLCIIDKTLKMIEAYSGGKYSGNLLDLLDLDFGDKIFIDNSKLDGLANFKSKCFQNCYKCRKCTDLYEEIMGKQL